MTPRHAPTRGLGLARILRRHLRDRTPIALIAILVAVLSGLLTAASRAEQRAADQALGAAVRAAEPGLRDINLSLSPQDMTFVGVPGTDNGQASAPFAVIDATARKLMGARVASLTGAPQMSAQSDYFPFTRLNGQTFADSPIAALRVQPGLAEHVTWVSGGPPGAASRTVPLRDRGGSRTVQVIPVAVSAQYAARFGVRLGDELRLDPDVYFGANGVSLRAVAVQIVGIFQARDTGDDFWTAEPGMLSVGVVLGTDGGAIPTGVIVVGEDGYSALTGALTPWEPQGGTTVMSTSAFGLEHHWRYAVTSDALRSDDVSELKAALTRLGNERGPWPTSIGSIRLASGLSTVIDRYAMALATTRALHAFATTALFALGLLCLALSSAVLLRRRAASIHLLGVRGISDPHVGALLAAETALAALPAAVLGWAVGRLLPSGPGGSAIPWGVVALALAPALVTASLAVRAARRGSQVRTRPTVWRAAAEILVLAVAGFAVATALSRGSEVARGTSDWSVAALPVLLALSVTLIVLRLASPALDLAGRVAARRTGFQAMLGLRRAATGVTGSVLPLATVAVAVTIATFLGSAVSTLVDQAGRTAYRSVGADVRIDAQRIDPGEIDALRARPGVGAVVPAYAVPRQLALLGGGLDPRRETFQLLAAAPAEYRQLVAGTDLAFTADPSEQAAGKVLPVAVSGLLAVGDTGSLSIEGTDVAFEVVAVDPALDRATLQNTAPSMVVSLAALRSVAPVVQVNTALLRTTPEAAQALSQGEPTALSEAVLSRRAIEAASVHDPLTVLIRSGAAAGGLVAAALTLVAVLLLLALTRPARLEMLLRLRTMGAPPRSGRAVGVIETLPGIVLAIVIGLASALIVPRLLASAFNLGPLVGAPPVTLVTPGALLGVIALAGIDLALLALLIDARQAARSDLGQALRRGESA